MRVGHPPEKCYQVTEEFTDCYTAMVIENFALNAYDNEFSNDNTVSLRKYELATAFRAVKLFLSKQGVEVDDIDLETYARVVRALVDRTKEVHG